MTSLAPDDWDAWQVLADQLSERGDARGELLLIDFEWASSEHSPEDDAGMDEGLAELVVQWLEEHLEQIGDPEDDAVRVYSRLRRDFPQIRALAPPALADAMSWTTTQVLADADRTGRNAQRHLESVVSTMLDWIEAAFDGVPPPGPENRTLRQAEAADNYDDATREPGESEGPWQSVADAYLLENQWALPHLDAEGLHYYLPAVMRFAVRTMVDPHPDDTWITESLEFSLYRADPDLRDYQRARLGLLEPGQRAAIAGFCWFTENPAVERWVRAAPEGADWYDRFVGSD